VRRDALIELLALPIPGGIVLPPVMEDHAMAIDLTPVAPDEAIGKFTGPALPDLFEVIDGEIVELPPMGFKQVFLANELKRLIDTYLARDSWGWYFVEGLFDLRPAANRNRRPDGAFLSFDRWPRSRPFPDDNALPAVPELAVEIVSSSDIASDLIDKIHEYFDAGSRLVWVVYPTVEEVYVYESPRGIRVLGRDDELEGGAVLPGFRLPLAELFGPRDEGESA
jgi:Uma2 family endonuclease